MADAAERESSAGRAVRVSIGDTSAELPANSIAKLAELLQDLSEGRDVTVAPSDLQLGTERAAEILGVSRPWLTTLMDRGDVPITKSGSKRRVRLGDLIAFRRAEDQRRREELTWEFLDEE